MSIPLTRSHYDRTISGIPINNLLDVKKGLRLTKVSGTGRVR